jgi:hypothetical protein
MIRRSVWLGALACAMALGPMARGDDRFEAVAPLLRGTCLTCHDPENRKGGLDLSRRASALAGGASGPAVAPGRPEESLLIDRLADGEMPPKHPLAPEQVEAFRAWVAAGAPYADEPLTRPRAGADWWSLQPVAQPSPPSVADSGWARTPIDLFILEGLERQGLRPAPETDRRTLIRRVTFDLTGLPPTPEEVEAFVGDQRPDAYERLVDRLLASPGYGERWGRHWLDAVRFAESHGYETNQLRPNAWPYRDYVIRAFNEDIPFARFVAEQFAGDALPEGDWLSRSATGFLVAGTHDVVGNQTVEGTRQQRADDLDDMINAVGSAFLGLSVQCARCHDHKFDAIAQRDYYGLKALLAGVEHADRDVPAPDVERRRIERAAVEAELARLDADLDADEPLAQPVASTAARPMVNSRRNVERFAPTPARFVRFTIWATNNGIEPCLDELEVWTPGPAPRNVALGARPDASSTYPSSDIHRLEHINDGRLGNGRSWIAATPGAGWVQLELSEAAVIERIVWGRDREEKFTDRTPTEYVIELAEEPGAWRVVASSADRAPWSADAQASPEPSGPRAALLDRPRALRAKLATLGDTLRVYAGTFRTPDEVHLLKRGDVMQEGEIVPPSALHAVAPALELPTDTPESERRLALARWITDERNPLPPRVVVNRLWQHHFGRGLVATPGDFGFQGEPPSHPELLDWLARRFLDEGGRLKPIHRLIVLSAAYRQASRPDPEAQAIDGQGRWLWRYPPQRLEAEAIRDALLATAGTLDRRMGGPGYWIWEPNTNYVVVFKPLDDLGPEHLRRMIYQDKPRSQADITFGAFDCPDAALVAPRRNVSTTALQALNLLNSRFVVAQAEAFADRLRREAGDDPDAQARRAFRLAFGRAPSDAERAAAVRLIEQQGAAALGRALFNANEFLYR